MIEFEPWPKTPRLSNGGVTITEKIDGTNACIIIVPVDVDSPLYQDDPMAFPVYVDNRWYQMGAQSRKRLITMKEDNAGFASWVWENRIEIVELLGAGRHFGEWWGQGIQRRYGMDRKVFSLFNYHRFSKIAQERQDWRNRAHAINMSMVPLISVGRATQEAYDEALDMLRQNGSFASAEWGVRFDRPEGIVIRHRDLGGNLKYLLENDDVPKSAVPKSPELPDGVQRFAMQMQAAADRWSG
jgi:hypothetical protein